MELTILKTNLWAPKAPKTSLFPELGWGGGEDLPQEVTFLPKMSKIAQARQFLVFKKIYKHFTL